MKKTKKVYTRSDQLRQIYAHCAPSVGAFFTIPGNYATFGQLQHNFCQGNAAVTASILIDLMEQKKIKVSEISRRAGQGFVYVPTKKQKGPFNGSFKGIRYQGHRTTS